MIDNPKNNPRRSAPIPKSARQLEEQALDIVAAARRATDRAFGSQGYAARNPMVVAALITAISQGAQQNT